MSKTVFQCYRCGWETSSHRARKQHVCDEQKVIEWEKDHPRPCNRSSALQLASIMAISGLSRP